MPKAGPRLTAGDRQSIQERFLTGESAQAIAALIGCDVTTVRYHIRRAGLSKGNLRHDGSKARAIEFLRNGGSVMEAVDLLGVKRSIARKAWHLVSRELVAAGTDRLCSNCGSGIHPGAPCPRRIWKTTQRSRRKFTEVELADMVQSVSNGESRGSVARRLNCATSVVSIRCKRAGVPPGPSVPKRWRATGNWAKARRLFEEGCGPGKAARICRVTRHSIFRVWQQFRNKLIAEGTTRLCACCQRPLHTGPCSCKVQRRRRQSECYPNSLSRKDPVYGEIARYIPPSISSDMRADIAGDIYIDVLSGALKLSDIGQTASKYIYRYTRALYLEASLDADLGGDGRSRYESLEDERALAAFDEIEW